MKWFKHDTDASQDAKLQNVLLDYGLEGYGLYWYCLELIAGKVDSENVTFELEHDARVIARNTGSTAQKVEEMMKYFVSIGLFENTQGVISCLKMAKRLDKSMTSNQQMRKTIEKIRLQNHDSIMIQSADSHDSVMTKSEKVMQEEKRGEENIYAALPLVSKADACKANAILSAYNEELGDVLQKATKLSDKRKKAINARWSEYINTMGVNGKIRFTDEPSGVEWFRRVFRKVKLNPHWIGDSNAQWRADFDWLMNPNNFLKVVEYAPARQP